MSIIRRFNIKLSEQDFNEVKLSQDPAQFTLTLEESTDRSVGTHRIIINNRKTFIFGNWQFRPETLFCDNNEGGARIELSASNLYDKTQYNFYIVENALSKDKESLLLDYVMTLIVAIACADSIEDFENNNKGTNKGKF